MINVLQMYIQFLLLLFTSIYPISMQVYSHDPWPLNIEVRSDMSSSHPAAAETIHILG